MPLDPTTVLALASVCAAGVAPTTLLAVARAESGLEPLAIHVNGVGTGALHPGTQAQALALARAWVAAGRTVDLGLGQINTRTLAALGVPLEAAFDPCRNLHATAAVLTRGYRAGVSQAGPGQRALRIAFSLYNTGDARRGFANGYVARVTSAPGQQFRSAPAARAAAPWDVFAVASARSTDILIPNGATP
jgi:type IV secretion system protein VirB1